MGASSVFAIEKVSILVNNERVESDVAPIIEKGRVLIPLRAVTESLGATVEWDQKTKTVTVKKWSRSVRLTVGKKIVSIEGSYNPLGFAGESDPPVLDVPAKYLKKRVYVPLRSISQWFGYEVKWERNSVAINPPTDKWRLWINGNLAESRKFATNLPYFAELQYLHEPFDVVQSEDYTFTYLFPEGEALRFYYIFRNTVSFIQLQDGFPVVVWQARVGEGFPMEQLFEGDFMEERGTAPTIKKSFLYYRTSMFGDSSSVEIGRIDPDGTITPLGGRSYIGGTEEGGGTISFELPNEKRVEWDH